MAQIDLGRGRIVLIDDEDFARVSEYLWHVSGSGDYPYIRACAGNGFLYLSRFLMDHPVGMVVDHANGNRFDNRRRNLRVCLASQNAKNRRLNRNTTSGYKGVSYEKQDRKWRALIRVDGKKISLGRHDSAEDAYKAYCIAAKKYHGEFARLA